MKTLVIDISQTDERDPLKIQVDFSDYDDVSVNTSLPFDQDVAFPAVLKILEQTEFSENYFSEVEVQRLKEMQLIYEHAGRCYLSPGRRKKIGLRLYDALIPEGKLRVKLKQAIQQADEVNEELHLEIKFSATAKLVGAHPWELLYDGEHFLCGGGICTLTRYIAFDSPKPRRKVQQGLKILLISPRPTDVQELLETSEADRIRDALSKLSEDGKVRLDVLEPPTFEAFKHYLSENSGAEMPHIIHFDGHGTFGRLCSKCRIVVSSPGIKECPGPGPGRSCGHPLGDDAQGYLAFEDNQAHVDYVSAERLEPQLRKAVVSMGSGELPEGLCLVVLSACKSALALQGESVFNGVAQRLISAHIPAVVAMQFRIRENEAASFVDALYRRIAKGDPLVEAVSWGWTNLDPESDQWYRPVLYLRWRDNEGGRLFDMEPVALPPTHDITKGSGPTCSLGRPEDFVTLTQRFIPGEGKPEEIAVDQRGVVKDFVRMLIPAWRKDVNWHMIMLQAPGGSGKSLALRRLEYICNYVRQRQEQPLIFCNIDLATQMTISPSAIALVILNKLHDCAQNHNELIHNASLLLDALIAKIGLPEPKSTEVPHRDWNPDTLTEYLYGCLRELSKQCTVVLLFDNYHSIMQQEAGKWLLRSFLATVGRGTHNVIAVIMSAHGLVDEETKPEGAKLFQAFSESLIEDVKELSSLVYPKNELDLDVARYLIEKAQAITPTPSMPLLRTLVDIYWKDRLTS